jgi:hypothetical protein
LLSIAGIIKNCLLIGDILIQKLRCSRMLMVELIFRGVKNHGFVREEKQ